MTTLEKTISMVKTLPEARQLELQKIISRWQRKAEPEFPETTVRDLQKRIASADEQYERGECIEMGQALEIVRVKYGL